MEFMDIDGSGYQAGRRIVNVGVGGFTPEIGFRSCVDDDRLVIGDGGWKIARDLVYRDGSGMERGELGQFWHGNCVRSETSS